MWRGYELALVEYGLEICEEWMKRGYKDSCHRKIFDYVHVSSLDYWDWYDNTYDYPPWLTEEFCSNHQSILLGKALEAKETAWMKCWNKMQEDAPNVSSKLKKLSRKHDKTADIWMWYQQFGWTEEPATKNETGQWPYLWPEVA